jgi:hypothetical protein
MFKSEQNARHLHDTKGMRLYGHYRPPQPKVERLIKMITKERDRFSPNYSALFGKPVVLLVVIRQFHVPMPCRIVSESAADVRIRIQSGWEMEVRKELIVAVEEDAVALPTRVN